MPRQLLEIESLAAFDEHIATTDHLSGWFLQSLDLTDRAEALAHVDPAGAVFLGCTFAEGSRRRLVRGGALLFPRIPDVPFNAYRATLYDAAELYDTPHYNDSVDARIYAWVRAAGPIPNTAATLAMSLHDHAITDALNDLHLDPRAMVGIMGGHAWLRTDPAYAAAARFSAGLAAAGRIILTGGGPGAMEAANLGAWFAGRPAELTEALDHIAAIPSFRPDIDHWASVALEVRERWPADPSIMSLGIPTWFYGHEPPNPFATHIAKYFANALREDTLLHRCRGGLIFLPGAAGTVQEIFQSVTANYYAADPTLIVPLVLVGRKYWTETYPAWQLLASLANDRVMDDHIHLVDDLDEAAGFIEARPRNPQL